MSRLKLAETDLQLQLLTRAVCAGCVALASSLDTLPVDTIGREMRGRWARQLRQAVRALELVAERLDVRTEPMAFRLVGPRRDEQAEP